MNTLSRRRVEMARSVTAIKDILKREERLLEKMKETVPLIAHKETKAALREAMKKKRADIRSYRAIIRRSEKCPAIKKPAGKPAAKKAASRRGR